MVLEFKDDANANLAAIAGGAYDSAVHAFVDDIKNDGNRGLWVRLLHEMNGDWVSGRARARVLLLVVHALPVLVRACAAAAPAAPRDRQGDAARSPRGACV
jgi:hypothetical protein